MASSVFPLITTLCIIFENAMDLVVLVLQFTIVSFIFLLLLVEYLGQMWVYFGQNGPFLKFPKKSKTVIFSTPFKQKLGNSDTQLWKKMENNYFL